MTTTDVERFRQWRMGHPSANQTQCPACGRPVMSNPDEDEPHRGTHCIHTDDCEYMAWCADELDTLDVESEPECSCYTGGLYSLGSVASIRAGDADPWCPEHGVEDVRSGAYASWNEAQRREFDRRLASGLRTDA